MFEVPYKQELVKYWGIEYLIQDILDLHHQDAKTEGLENLVCGQKSNFLESVRVFNTAH